MNLQKITHLPYWLLKAKPSGLKKTPKDPRNFKTGLWGWGDYKPKQERHVIKTISIKDQGSKNTCQWNATTVQKEVDENNELSVMGLTAKGYKDGFISGDGFSNLDSGQKVLKNWGIPEESILPERQVTFYEYVKVNLDVVTPNANKHKTSSYWEVSSRNDILKLLDEGRVLTTGMDWYTGFNQGGGFKYPWIIDRKIGYSIGGHAFDIIGYDLDYFGGRKVYVMQNSYGRSWGDNGKFYIDMTYFDRNNWGVYANLDVGVDVGKFLTEYDGKCVKGSKSTIYFIQKGQKKAIPDEVTYFAFFPSDPMIMNYILVKDEILAKIPSGDDMDITKSLYWDMLRNLEGNEARINKLIEILNK